MLLKYSNPPKNLSLFDLFFDDNFIHENKIPDYDIIENDNEFILNMMLPGFEKDKIIIKTEKNSLIIEGEREKDEKTKFIYRKSFYGKFKKSFDLPENVNGDKINASFADGILSLKIPKDSKMELSKTIKIE